MAMQRNMPLFDGYIAVDWSARAVPCHGPNSIWIAVVDGPGPVQFMNPHTRQEAMNRIQELLDEATRVGRRLLCGFDFAFGYPEGTAQMMTGGNNWEAVWALIAEVIVDLHDNCNNRFDAAAELNRHFDGDGPFWGNGLKRDIQYLPRLRPQGGWGQNLPPARRHAEEGVPAAQEVWKLSGIGSVGSQSLMGIKRLEEIRHRDDVQVWPFETLGEGRCHVLAEIYPSLLPPNPGYEVPDQAQVHAVAARLSEMDEEGLLAQRLQIPLDMPVAVLNEEALFLDII